MTHTSSIERGELGGTEDYSTVCECVCRWPACWRLYCKRCSNHFGWIWIQTNDLIGKTDETK